VTPVAAPVRAPRPSRPDGAVKPGRPWLVIVLNDDHNTFDGVAFALAHTIPGISFDQGLRLANRIDATGRAIVWRGHRELAELYWERLRQQGLTMAPLEQAP
jgi:ATP-dependent Clp protease adaptor protein ClpS